MYAPSLMPVRGFPAITASLSREEPESPPVGSASTRQQVRAEVDEEDLHDHVPRKMSTYTPDRTRSTLKRDIRIERATRPRRRRVSREHGDVTSPRGMREHALRSAIRSQTTPHSADASKCGYFFSAVPLIFHFFRIFCVVPSAYMPATAFRTFGISGSPLRIAIADRMGPRGPRRIRSSSDPALCSTQRPASRRNTRQPCPSSAPEPRPCPSGMSRP